MRSSPSPHWRRGERHPLWPGRTACVTVTFGLAAPGIKCSRLAKSAIGGGV